MKSRLLHACTAALLLGFGPVHGADYPDRPIRLIVPFGAGGLTDINARQVAKGMSELLGQNIVVENKTGAGGTIAAQAAASAAPDGYTMFIGSVGTQVVNPLIMKQVNYNPDKDFDPVGMVSGSPFLLASRSDLPAKNYREFVDHAKAHPGELNFGSAGNGSSPHLGLELLKLTAGVDIVHIPFKSGIEAVNAAAAGQTQVTMDAITVVMPQVESGKLTALCLATDQRAPAARDVPTCEEAGNAGLRITSWNAFFVPAGTPQDRIDTLNAALQKALENQELNDRFASQGTQPFTGTMEEYRSFIKAEKDKWEDIVKRANIHVG